MGFKLYLPVAFLIFVAATTGADVFASMSLAGQPFAPALREIYWARVELVGTLLLLAPFVVVAGVCALVERRARTLDCPAHLRARDGRTAVFLLSGLSGSPTFRAAAHVDSGNAVDRLPTFGHRLSRRFGCHCIRVARRRVRPASVRSGSKAELSRLMVALGRKPPLARRTKLLSYRIANVLALAADRSIEDNLRASSFPPPPPATPPRMVVSAGCHLHRHPRGHALCYPRRARPRA